MCVCDLSKKSNESLLLDSLGLSIYLTSTSVANFTTQTIAAAADVSKSSPQTDNGVTFYEHSINYAIPSTTPAGSYNVSNAHRTATTRVFT